MADQITIALDSPDIFAALARAQNLLAAPEAMMESIAKRLRVNVTTRFDAKVDVRGKRWPDISEKTRKRYEKKYGTVPGTLLSRAVAEDSEDLADSITHNSGADFAEVGFTASYATFHMTGTRKGLPRRDSLFDAIAFAGNGEASGTLGPQDEADILEIVEDHLRQALGDAAS